MKFNSGFKVVWLLPLAIGGLAFILLPLLLRRSETSAPAPIAVPPGMHEKATELSVPPPSSPALSPPADPLLRRWQTAIRLHDARGVLEAQSAFLAREGVYREPLAKMATEDPDPRIRAFCVAVLGRMKSPPPEGFFIDRLSENSEHPRTSALNSLERIGTSTCLSVVDRLAASDSDEGVRAAAVRTAKAVRSR